MRSFLKFIFAASLLPVLAILITLASNTTLAKVFSRHSSPAWTILDEAGENSGHFVTRTDPSGRIYALWVQYVKGIATFQLSWQQDDLKTWSPPVSVSAQKYHAFTPDIAFDGNGNAMGIWVQESSYGVNLVFAREIRRSGEMGPIQLLQPNFTALARTPLSTSVFSGAYTPHIYFDHHAGKWLAIWSQWDGWSDRIFVSERPPNGNWSPAAIIDAGRTDAYTPALCINRQGKAVAVWYQLDTSKNSFDRVFYAFRNSDGKWATAGDPSFDYGSSSFPDVACDGDDAFNIYWQQSDGVDGFRLWAASIRKNGEIEKDRLILQPADVQRSEVSAAASTATTFGTTALAWCAEHERHQTLDFAEIENGDIRGNVTVIPLKEGTCFNPSIATDSDGRLLVVWVEESAQQQTHVKGMYLKPRSPLKDKTISFLRRFHADWSIKAENWLRPKAFEIFSLPKETGALAPADKPVPPRFTQHAKLSVQWDGKEQFWVFWNAKHDGRHKVFAMPVGESG